MEWIDGNIGSGLNMKYPTTILKGDHATAKCISIAASGKKMTMDTGAKMIHLGKNTRSNIVSKSICISGGISNYRGTINIGKNSTNSYSEVKCDTLILDNKSSSDTIPTEIITNSTSFIKHEAKISDLDREMEFYMNKNAIDKKEAQQLLSLGFIQPFANELPLEYAIELKRLLKQII
jgi:Fe-S cluster assembly protein SufB